MIPARSVWQYDVSIYTAKTLCSGIFPKHNDPGTKTCHRRITLARDDHVTLLTTKGHKYPKKTVDQPLINLFFDAPCATVLGAATLYEMVRDRILGSTCLVNVFRVKSLMSDKNQIQLAPLINDA
jgi:hypothetical protein